MDRLLRQLKRGFLAEGGLPLIWIALTVLALVPIWSQRLLPHLDTPNHLALVRGWHEYNKPEWRIAEFYKVRVRPVPYFLFYLSINLLMYVTDIETANKLYLSSYVILYPLSILALARALKRSPWLALGGFLLCFNQNWIYGFSSFLMGTVFLFFSLAALLRYLDGGRRRDVIGLGVLALLCYFSHVETWFCFGLAAIALLLLYWRDWRRGLWASLAMLPSLLFAVAAVLEEKHDRSYFKTDREVTTFSAAWRDFPTSVMEFPRRVMELFPGNLDTLILVILSVTVLGLCISRGTWLPDDSKPQRKRLGTLLILWFVTYLTLPYQIFKPMAWWYVAPRLPAMMAPLMLMLPALPTVAGWTRVVFVPLIACAIALPLHFSALYRSFSARNAPFMKLITKLPRGATVLVVVRNMMRGPTSEETSGDPASSGPVYWHFSSWPMALNGGYSPYLFDQGIPLQPRKEKKLKAPNWTTPDTFNLRQAPEFEYYIVRDATDELNREPSIKAIERYGDWTLYKRIYDSTDEP